MVVAVPVDSGVNRSHVESDPALRRRVSLLRFLNPKGCDLT